jgi:plasmid stabilization system protein ParE
VPRLFVRKAANADVAEAFAWYEARRVGLGREFADEIAPRGISILAVLHGHRDPQVWQQRR